MRVMRIHIIALRVVIDECAYGYPALDAGTIGLILYSTPPPSRTTVRNRFHPFSGHKDLSLNLFLPALLKRVIRRLLSCLINLLFAYSKLAGDYNPLSESPAAVSKQGAKTSL